MIVGFTITDFKGHEDAAVEYINRVCILESPEIAQNIVDAGPGVNIFSKGIDIDELKRQPFLSSPIETQDGRYIIVSAVNFNLELLYNSRILRLVPTEYIYISPEEVVQFEEYIHQGLVSLIPEIRKDGKSWILDEGNWNDDGIWVDNDFWRDGNE